MARQSPYTTLGVDRAATAGEIKRAFHGLSKRVPGGHPDKNGGTPEANAAWQPVQAAYELLADALERPQYDRTGRWPDERPQGRATVQVTKTIRHQPRASLSLSASIHLNVLNNSDNRMCL